MEQRNPNAPIDCMEKLPRMARRLEESLFRGSASFDEYKDKSTLEKRMQKLALDMGIRSRENSKGHMNNEANGSVCKGVGIAASPCSSSSSSFSCEVLEGKLNNEANGSVRTGVATRHSTRSSTMTGAPKGIAASSSSSSSSSFFREVLEGKLNNEANGSVRKGVATRQSTRSSTTTGAPKGIAASSSSSLSFSNSVRSALAATRAPGAASRRRLDSVSPVEYILSCSEDTEPLVISVFHYLTDSDLYNASLVCKAYLKTAFDQALWDYDGLNDGLHPAVDEIDGSILLSM